MKKFMEEFKAFIMRGNVMDMAVGVIIGGAFTSIVTSLTTDIIQPLIAILSGGGTEVSTGMDITVGSNTISFSSFISSVINFLIIALIVFCLVKSISKLQSAADALMHKEKEEEEATAPTCPHCLEEVKEGATRCPHCGGEIPGGAKAK